MSDLERDLDARLKRYARQMSRARDLNHHDVRKIRARQALVAVAAITSLILVAFGGLIGLRAATSFQREPDQRNRPLNVAALPSPVGPESSWLYVLDPQHQDLASQVLALDPEASSNPIVRRFQTGYDPAMTVSPDGSRLYVASFPGEPGKTTDELSTFDTATGNLIRKTSIEQAGQPQFRAQHTGATCCPEMVISHDGRWIYFLQQTAGAEGEQDFFIGTFDTVSNQVLPQSASISGCIPGALALMPSLIGRAVTVVCPASNDVRFLEISDTGTIARSETLRLPEITNVITDSFGNQVSLAKVAFATLSEEQGLLYAVTQDGHVFVVNPATHQLLRTVRLQLPEGRAVGHAQVAISPDASRLYLGVGVVEDFGRVMPEEILAFETATWQRLATISMSEPVWSFTLGRGGSRLYAISNEGPRVMVVDTLLNKELRVLQAIGETPQLAEVPLAGRYAIEP